MNKMNKKGFTLIEMLVVIAIIAVLVSIIIPTVTSATTKAQAATTAANLRSCKAEIVTKLLTGELTDVTTYAPPTGTKFYDAGLGGSGGFNATGSAATGVTVTYNGHNIQAFADIAGTGSETPETT